MRLLLALLALSTCAATDSTTVRASATVLSVATLTTGPGFVEFASNDPDAVFLLDDRPLLAGTYTDDGLRMADGWRPSDASDPNELLATR